MIRKRFTVVFVGILLILFAGLSVASSLRESLTFDEIVHIQEGKNALLAHTFVIDTNNPPLIRELAVVPLVLGVEKMIHSPYPNIQMLPARLVIVILGIFLCVSVFWFAKKYVGREAALFALLLFVFEPNTLAHSHYVTQDIGVTLFFFLTYMVFVRLLAKPTKTNFMVFGVLAGLMASSKISVLPYFFVSALTLSLLFLKKKCAPWFWQRRIPLSFAICISLLVIWATYFFKSNVVIAPGGNSQRLSVRLTQTSGSQLVINTIRFFQTQPIPLGDYIAVLKNTVIRSTQPQKTFFLGTFYANVHSYFMVATVVLKSSLPLLLLFIVGFWLGLSDKINRQSILIFGVPVAAILLVGSMSHMQPWNRYMLPLYPFVVVIAASSLRHFNSTLARILLILLCLWHVQGTLSYYPHFIAFKNEIVSRNTSYTKFMDANMDWGQSLPDLARYKDMVHPGHISFSYFGRDNGDAYGLVSNFAYGSHKYEDICAFHEINYPGNSGASFTAISLSNWYYCGYNLDPKYSKSKLKTIVGDAILIY